MSIEVKRAGAPRSVPLPGHDDFATTELVELPAAAAPGGLASLSIDRSASSGRVQRRWWPWAIGGGVACLVVVVAWQWIAWAPEVKAASVVLSAPSQQYVSLTASGYVVAQTRAAVASKAAGRLVELKVREGSTVLKDQLIARLDASDVRAAIASAAANVSQAEALVRLAEAEQLHVGSELKRSENLAATGFLSPQAVENARTRLSTSVANVVAARAGLAQSKAQLKLQKVNQDFTEIRAPFNGVVLMKNANVGDMITPMSSAAGAQGAVVTMADMSTLEVEADVSEGNLSKASPGQPVEITLDALPGRRFSGRVVGIVPTVDRTKATVMTKIKFDQLDPRILPEMSAKVAFLTQPVTAADQRPVLAVNPSAVVKREGAAVVFRLRDQNGKLQLDLVQVRTGRSLGELLEVTAMSPFALKAGDKLVLSPPDKLVAGSHVRLASS